MMNVYEKHLLQIQALPQKDRSRISLFVPVLWGDSSPEMLFRALVKTANGLLLKDAKPQLSIASPDWDQWKTQGTMTLAIYIDGGVVHSIPLPLHMPPRVVVAESFHVKPLVAAAQGMINGIHVHFHEMGASVYRVNAGDCILIETYLPSKSHQKGDWTLNLDRSELIDFLCFLRKEVRAVQNPQTRILGISGLPETLLRSPGVWKGIKLQIFNLEDSAKKLYPEKALGQVRVHLVQEINQSYANQVMKLLLQRDELTHTDLSGLGTQILKGEIKRLCVSLEDVHFGLLNSETGVSVMTRSQSGSRDDDLLDDLVELAMKNGVEVSVVPKVHLPLGKTYLAS
jgi:hypothetical protein